jgi:4-diphosphocytidyl-2-C-methyl-D-erythritol kinase
MRRVEALAAAKLNLSLVVKSPRPDGLHPIGGRFQSIDWLDRLVVDPNGEPGVFGVDGRPVVAGEENLAWVASQRAAATLEADPVEVRLDKQIAVAAGLGGGSADAAAALAATTYATGGVVATVAPLAAGLGSDVPFCLVGGCADVSGTGERVRPVAVGLDYAVGLVVPPFEVATAAVYSAWDVLGEPAAAPIAERALPPSLRTSVAVRNDLTEAAVAVAPEIAEWRAELETAWSRPVALSGSGPTLFAFFLDGNEAEAALAAAPPGARHVRAVAPIGWGWAVRFDGADTVDELVPLPVDDVEAPWHVARPGTVVSALG